MALGTQTLPKVLKNMTYGVEIEFMADAKDLLPGDGSDSTADEIVHQTCHAIWSKILRQKLGRSMISTAVYDKRGQLGEDERKYQSWIVDHDVTVDVDRETSINAD